jgi:thiol-disulfide isomerase/thioredoxin
MRPGRREALMLAAAGVAAAAAGFLAGPALLRLGEEGKSQGSRLFAASLPDLAGNTRRLAEWRGRLLVCNFWATWCAPCREEIPLFIAARAKYAPGVAEIVGIAVDNRSKVSEFVATYAIPYPILLADVTGLELTRELGNSSGGLPYTVILDRAGSIAHRKLGAFKAGQLDTILADMTRA